MLLIQEYHRSFSIAACLQRVFAGFFPYRASRIRKDSRAVQQISRHKRGFTLGGFHFVPVVLDFQEGQNITLNYLP